MSLDVYLKGAPSNRSGSGIFVRRDGQTQEITRAEWDAAFPGREPIVAEINDDDAFSANITHNLNRMADAAGIYKELWRPEEIGITTAEQLIAPLEAGLVRLKADPDKYAEFNPENGWGNYDGLVRFVSDYLAACKESPAALVRVSR